MINIIKENEKYPHYCHGSFVKSLQWHHNERDGVSNHQRLDCLFNRVFRRKSKKTSKLHVTGLCEGNSPVTGEFPAQRASNAENVSTWWRHRVLMQLWVLCMGVRSSNVLQWLDSMIGHQDISTNNGHRGDMTYFYNAMQIHMPSEFILCGQNINRKYD